MSKFFETIYLEPQESRNPNYDRMWCDCDEWDGEGVKYVRADLLEAAEKRFIIAAEQWADGDINLNRRIREKESVLDLLKPSGVSVATWSDVVTEIINLQNKLEDSLNAKFQTLAELDKAEATIERLKHLIDSEKKWQYSEWVVSADLLEAELSEK